MEEYRFYEQKIDSKESKIYKSVLGNSFEFFDQDQHDEEKKIGDLKKWISKDEQIYTKYGTDTTNAKFMKYQKQD